MKNERQKAARRAYRKQPRGKFERYKWGAKLRKHSFELSFDYFLSLITSGCYYCGAIENFVGVDRLDNTRGYTPDNVVPCCFPCNGMKGTRKLEIFLEKCRDIAKKHPK